MRLFSEFPDGSYRAHSATVVGDVTIGELCSFWFNAVVRGDVASITLGRQVNVQDNAVIHCDTGVANLIEDNVSIGHGAILHGALVRQGSLIGMHATLLSRSRIGAECIVAAGAVVAPDRIIPDRQMVMGVPARVVRPLTDAELKYIRWISPHYVALAQRYARGEFDG